MAKPLTTRSTLLLLLLSGGTTACQSCEGASSRPPTTTTAPIPSSPPPSGPGASRTPLEAMSGDDPGRCVKQVIVGGNSICFEFNRDYYWCRGGGRAQSIMSDPGTEAVDRRRNSDKPYNVIPYHFSSLHLGVQLGCGLDEQRRALCWGDNSSRLIPGPRGVIREPVLMDRLPTPIDEFSVFDSHYCSRSGNAVWCSDSEPRNFTGLGGDIRAIGTGSLIRCAASDREVWCWTLGMDWATVLRERGSTSKANALRVLPISLPDGLRIKSLQVGLLHACVLGEDGGVYCFGEGKYSSWGTGERPVCNYDDLPDGCAGTRTAHFVETLGRNVKQLAVNGVVSCALKSDGSVWCWGDNATRVVSNNDKVIEDHGERLMLEPLPKQRTELGRDNQRLLVGVGHACVEKNDGALWCWGGNEGGQFGGVRVQFIPPQPIPLPAPRCKP